MDCYVFSLNSADSGAFEGLVVIFATPRQQVWRRFTTDYRPVRMDHVIALNEVRQFGVELAGLSEGETTFAGPSLLHQLFADYAVTHDHRVTFNGRRTFALLAHSEATFRNQVDYLYEQQEGAG